MIIGRAQNLGLTPPTASERATFFAAIQDITSINLGTLSTLFSEVSPMDLLSLIGPVRRSMQNDACNCDLTWRSRSASQTVPYAALLRQARINFQDSRNELGPGSLPAELRPCFILQSVRLLYVADALAWDGRMRFSGVL